MMMPPLPPIMPLPPRSAFDSEEAYLSARDEHLNQIREREEMMKSNTAFLICTCALLVACMIVVIGAALYFAGGVKAIAYGAFAAGLFWVFYEQVRMRL